MDLFRLKACQKCRGDLVLDEGDWLCLQCGRYYYTGLYQDRPGQPGGSQWARPALPPPRTEKHFKRWLSPVAMNVVEQINLVPSAGNVHSQAVRTPAVRTNEGGGNGVTAVRQC